MEEFRSWKSYISYFFSSDFTLKTATKVVQVVEYSHYCQWPVNKHFKSINDIVFFCIFIVCLTIQIVMILKKLSFGIMLMTCNCQTKSNVCLFLYQKGLAVDCKYALLLECRLPPMQRGGLSDWLVYLLYGYHSWQKKNCIEKNANLVHSISRIFAFKI